MITVQFIFISILLLYDMDWFIAADVDFLTPSTFTKIFYEAYYEGDSVHKFKLSMKATILLES